MKHLLILLPLMAFGQSLNEYGQHFKTNEPAAYEVIKQHASAKWGTDYNMVIFQINQQCKACYDFFQLMKDENKDEEIALAMLLKWAYDGYEVRNGQLIEEGRLLELHVDWQMILFEYKQQMKAKSSF